MFKTIFGMFNCFTTRSNKKSEISKIQKEGQDSRLDDLSEEYKKVVESLKRLQRGYNDMLENASTDNEEILSYEKYVNSLHEIINELKLQLNCKGINQNVSALEHSTEKSVTQARTTIESDLKKENPEDTAIAPINLIDKMIINLIKNKNEKTKEPFDWHHRQNRNQRTFKRLQIGDLDFCNVSDFEDEPFKPKEQKKPPRSQKHKDGTLARDNWNALDI